MRVLLLAALVLAGAGVRLALLANSDAAVPGRTGGFGGPTCQACHTGAPLNAPGAALAISGLPERYSAGESYRITVQLKGAGLAHGGFSVASRFASGTLARQQAGLWQAADARISFYTDVRTKVQYAQHSAAGTRAAAPGTIAWELEWKAPAEAEPVQFNVAATVSNNDRSPLGDAVYTREITVPAALR